MEIAFHLGVHCTDDGRLVRSLLRSRAALILQGIAVPPPRRYRSMLRETLNILDGMAANADVEGLLIDTLSDDEAAHRIVLFHESLICIPQRAISNEGLYPMAARRITGFSQLFPSHDTAFYMALCNPATLVPTLALRAGPNGYETVTDGAIIQRLSWLTTIRRILEANPGVSLTLWCNEDTPLVWHEVLRALTGISPDVALEGDLDLLSVLLTDEGLEQVGTDLSRIATGATDARRAAITRALESHARPEEMEIDVPLAGWTDAMIAAITARYESDCAAIAALPGVRFIAP